MHLRKSVPKQNNILQHTFSQIKYTGWRTKAQNYGGKKKRKACNENLFRPEPFRTADLEHTITVCTKKKDKTRNVLLLLHKEKKVICNKNCRLNHNFIPSVTWYISLTVSHFSSSQPLTLSVFLYLCFPLILSSSLSSLFLFPFLFLPIQSLILFGSLQAFPLPPYVLRFHSNPAPSFLDSSSCKSNDFWGPLTSSYEKNIKK